MKITIDNVGDSQGMSALFYFLGLPMGALMIGSFIMGIVSVCALLEGKWTDLSEGLSIMGLLVGILILYFYIWNKVSMYVDQKLRFITWKNAVEDAGLDSQAQGNVEVALELFESFPNSFALRYLNKLNPKISEVYEKGKVSIWEYVVPVLGAVPLICVMFSVWGSIISIISIVLIIYINWNWDIYMSRFSLICSVAGLIANIIVTIIYFAV